MQVVVLPVLVARQLRQDRFDRDLMREVVVSFQNPCCVSELSWEGYNPSCFGVTYPDKLYKINPTI